MKDKDTTPQSSKEQEEKLLKQWKREKALNTAKEIGANVLCGVLNGFIAFGMMGAIANPNATPKYVTPEDLFPTKKF